MAAGSSRLPNFSPNLPLTYFHQPGSNKPRIIDLSKAAPTPSLLPTAALAYSASEVLMHPHVYTDALLVGGTSKLRPMIASWLGSYYSPGGWAINEARIAVTTGVQEGALAAILGRFTDPVYTRTVWAVVPAELEWLKATIGDAGLGGKLRTLPEGNNDEGIDFDMFKSGLQEEEDRALLASNLWPVFKTREKYPKIYKSILFLQPTFKNPTGSTIPVPIRERLVELALKYDVLIVAEEDFDFIRWGDAGSPVPRLCDIDRIMVSDAGKFGNAVSCGSFGRVTAPGCMVGWIEGFKCFIEELGKANSTKASQVMEMTMWNLLSTGTLQSHLSNVLIPIYQGRHSAVVSAITKFLAPLGVNLITNTSSTCGGWFLWVELPGYCDESFLKRLKNDYNIILAGGSGFGAGWEGFVRICIAWEAEEDLVEAMRRILECLQGIKPKHLASGIEGRGF